MTILGRRTQEERKVAPRPGGGKTKIRSGKGNEEKRDWCGRARWQRSSEKEILKTLPRKRS